MDTKNKRKKKSPGGFLKLAMIVGSLYGLGAFHGGALHWIGLLTFVLWLAHQCECCWKKVCVHCTMQRDLAAWGFKRCRKEENFKTIRGQYLLGLVNRLALMTLEENIKSLLRFHRNMERLYKRTIPLAFPGYQGQGPFLYRIKPGFVQETMMVSTGASQSSRTAGSSSRCL